MIRAGIAVLLMILNLILYFFFGMLVMPKKGDRRICVSEAVFAGFFLYYFLFALVCIPIMYKWRPLSMLTGIWGTAVPVICAVSFIVSFRSLKKNLPAFTEYLKKNLPYLAAFLVITVVMVIIVVCNYQFTLDAAYYVANVTTSLQTDTLNIYDPYTGAWQDHFEMRYFFAVFPLNDAVFCSIFKIHPLIWCKTTIAGDAIILTNLVLFMTGKRLFRGDHAKTLLFVLFADVMNFFFITIYTTSTFLLTRTYEGKSLLGNVVLPGVFYIYMRLSEDQKSLYNWGLLFLVAIGSPVLSSSSNMLIPAMIAVTIMPLCILKRDITVIFKSLVCMLPEVILMLTYVAYVKGKFVFYTYPR